MSISRRKFLGWMGAAGAGVAASGTAVQASKEFKGYPDSMGVLHDTVLCVGCRSCEAACSKENKLGDLEKPFRDLSVLNEMRRTENNAYTVVNQFDSKKKPGTKVFVKKQCNHCLEPACASACFVQAFKKTPTGAVVYNPDVCVGCRYCMIACPFEIPTYEYEDAFTPEVKKCTMCSPRVEKGLLPACVESCPKDALIFGKRDDLIKIARRRVEKRPDLYVDHIYGEHEMGGTSWLYVSGEPFGEVGMREDLGVVSAPELTHGALSVIPMVVGLWPAFLTGMYAMTKRREKITNDEKANAVKDAIERTEATGADSLSAALAKADKDKETAINNAVKKALEEAAKPTTDEEEA